MGTMTAFLLVLAMIRGVGDPVVVLGYMALGKRKKKTVTDDQRNSGSRKDNFIVHLSCQTGWLMPTSVNFANKEVRVPLCLPPPAEGDDSNPSSQLSSAVPVFVL